MPDHRKIFFETACKPYKAHSSSTMENVAEEIFQTPNTCIRKPNFSPEEKLCLSELIKNHGSVIEDKRLDKYSNDKKEKAWQLIVKDFNNSFPGKSARTLSEIRRLWIR